MTLANKQICRPTQDNPSYYQNASVFSIVLGGQASFSLALLEKDQLIFTSTIFALYIFFTMKTLLLDLVFIIIAIQSILNLALELSNLTPLQWK